MASLHPLIYSTSLSTSETEQLAIISAATHSLFSSPTCTLPPDGNSKSQAVAAHIAALGPALVHAPTDKLPDDDCMTDEGDELLFDSVTGEGAGIPPPDSETPQSTHDTQPPPAPSLQLYELSAKIRSRALLSVHTCIASLFKYTTADGAADGAAAATSSPPPPSLLNTLHPFLASRVTDPPSAHLCFNLATLLIQLYSSHPYATQTTPIDLYNLAHTVLDNAEISALPRVARSDAFKLITTVATIPPPDNQTADTAECKTAANKLASTAASTLFGEKDPRCLHAGLQALHHVQTTVPFTTPNIHGEHFDAVCPYYPITFTPPPNDPHGITSEGLRTSLLQVLKGTAETPEGGDAYDDVIKLVFERIGGVSGGDEGEDEMIPVSDRVAGVADARQLLLDVPVTKYKNVLNDVRVALITGYEAITQAGDATKAEELLLLLTQVGSAVEHSTDPKTVDCFGVFNRTIIQNVAQSVVDAPESVNGRGNARFLCAVAKSGPKSLACALGVTCRSLVALVENLQDEVRAEAAAAAVGMLFVASRSELCHCPDPVEEYVQEAFGALRELGRRRRSVGGVLAVNAVLVSPPEVYVEGEEVREYCEELLEVVLDSPTHADDAGYKHACAYALGSILGSGRYSGLSDPGLLPRLLQSLDNQFSRETLSKACSLSKSVCDIVVPSIVENVCSCDERSGGASKALEFVLGKGGASSVAVFEEKKFTTVILEAFTKMAGRDETALVVEECIHEISLALRHCGTLTQQCVMDFFVPILGASATNFAKGAVKSTLSLLAAAVEGVVDERGGEMLPKLVAMALDTEFEARAAAAKVIQSVVSRGDVGNAGVVMEILEGAMKKSGKLGVSDAANLVSVLSMLGGAAYVRGGKSAKAGDMVVKLLCDLVVDGESELFKRSRAVEVGMVRVMGGEGLGVVVSMRGGNNLWRQRAASIVAPKLLAYVATKSGDDDNNDDVLGALLGCAHLSCCLPIAIVGKAWGGGAGSVNLVTGLVVALQLAEKRGGEKCEGWQRGAWESLVGVAMGGLVRVTSLSEMSDYDKHLAVLFPALLFFAEQMTGAVDHNVMSLQCLMNLCDKDLGKIKVFIGAVCMQLRACCAHRRQEVRAAAVVVRNKYLLCK